MSIYTTSTYAGLPVSFDVDDSDHGKLLLTDSLLGDVWEVEVRTDEAPENPREFCTAGTLWIRDGRNLAGVDEGEFGDELERLFREYDGGRAFEMARVWLMLTGKAVAVLPVYSGSYGEWWTAQEVGCSHFANAVTGRRMAWGSSGFWGEVDGLIYLTAEEWHSIWGEGPVQLSQAERVVRCEVETYSQWASGEVYGYTVESEDDEDSCSGFYGDDHAKSGLLDAAAGWIAETIEDQINAEKKAAADLATARASVVEMLAAYVRNAAA